MAAAPQPCNEAARLKLLRSLGVLDSKRQSLSESIALAAATIANTPMSAITLVDADRQWFKATCGITVTETPRAASFCAHAILADTPLLVPNALDDERFRDNPLVTGSPHVRFYAGFPLMVDTLNLGALCVIDDRARTLDASQLDRLGRLAVAVSEWLGSHPRQRL